MMKQFSTYLADRPLVKGAVYGALFALGIRVVGISIGSHLPTKAMDFVIGGIMTALFAILGMILNYVVHTAKSVPGARKEDSYGPIVGNSMIKSVSGLDPFGLYGVGLDWDDSSDEAKTN